MRLQKKNIVNSRRDELSECEVGFKSNKMKYKENEASQQRSVNEEIGFYRAKQKPDFDAEY